MKRSSTPKYTYLILYSTSLLLFLCIPQMSQAQETMVSSTTLGIDFIDNHINLGSANPIDIVISLINLSLSFLATILLVMILSSGFLFMISGSSDEKRARARRMFWGALIGATIILFSVSIVRFVFESFADITNSSVKLFLY